MEKYVIDVSRLHGAVSEEDRKSFEQFYGIVLRLIELVEECGCPIEEVLPVKRVEETR